MGIKKHIGYVLIALCCFFTGCVKPTYFGKSAYKKILYFTLAQESGTTIINQDSLIIRITVDGAADITKLYPDSIKISTYATISPALHQPQNFTNAVIYTVTAEDGSTINYKVVVSKQSADPQINNSNFDWWYTPAGKSYQEPGRDINTEWASGNAGTVTLGNANTTPLQITTGDLAAQMVTLDLGALAQVTGQRMAAATLFTGSFVLDIANPINSAKFGIPFTSKPKSFSVDYKYTPGTTYKNGTGKVLTKKDSCDIYLLLENRSGGITKRVATAWLRSGEQVNSLTNINIPLVYGTLPAGTPSYQLPVNNLYAAATDVPTHIIIVFASSAYGNLYEGAVNSTLVVNNLILHY